MLHNIFPKLFSIDERFIMHRYLSTRLAVSVAAIVAATWITYDYYFKHLLQVELLVVMGVMAVVKVAAMLYLQWRR
jgi:hypothetical protein